jgi:hypothetical protein
MHRKLIFIFTELCYQFMYVELNGKRAPRDPWSFRQTGVYHKFSATNNNSQIILLHPNNEAVAQSRLEALAHTPHKAELTQHPLNIHLVIISTYLSHYQEHIESLADELEQIVSNHKLLPPLCTRLTITAPTYRCGGYDISGGITYHQSRTSPDATPHRR